MKWWCGVVVVSVDEEGRVVIPKKFREAASLGRLVEMKLDGDRIIIKRLDPPLSSSIAEFHIRSTDIPKIRGSLERLLRKMLDEGLS
ncbi:MAG: hypothetical protein DRN96_08700 [Thermoproteota archaeon]|nr:MAG: hypothetical protein DRN96_08700 [Candidatus Korarchaeota archaeon]RLG55085.1 MAG: hypothetical protein DRN99_03685 [Candidatus Korarchaeota archaeon]